MVDDERQRRSGVSVDRGGGGASGVTTDGPGRAHGTGVATEHIPQKGSSRPPPAASSAADKVKAIPEWFKDLFAKLEADKYYDTGRTLGIVDLLQRFKIIEGAEDRGAEESVVLVVEKIEKLKNDKVFWQALSRGDTKRTKFENVWLPTLKTIAISFDKTTSDKKRSAEGWGLLRDLLKTEIRREGLERLEWQAGSYYANDGKIDAGEYASLCRDFVRFGVVDADVLAACQRFEGKAWVPPAPAPEATRGFEAYKPWRTEKKVTWTMDDLLDAVESHFASGPKSAVDGILASEDDLNFFAGWLSAGSDRAQQTAFAARQEGVTYFGKGKQDGVGREVAAWVFLWELGRTALHLAPPGAHIALDVALRARTTKDLAERIATRAGGLQAAGDLLRSGVLEAWLERVPKVTNAAEDARRGRRHAARAPDPDAAAYAAVHTVLWTAEKDFRDLILDVEGAPSRVRSVEELVAVSGKSASHFAAYQVAFHSGALEAWLRQFDKQRVATVADAVRHGALADFAWRWIVGADDYFLKPRASDADWVSVSGKDDLIARTDTGEGILEDTDDLESGLLATYCRLALRREDLALLAEEYAGDDIGRPAERWRQRAGAGAFVVAGRDASSREAFARLGLELGRPADGGASLNAEDIVGVLAAGIVEARFGAQRPELSQGLKDLRLRTDVDVEQRALLACLLCGLVELPLLDAGGAIRSPVELLEAVRGEPARYRLVRFLESGVLGQWVMNVAPANRIDAKHVLAAREMCRAAPTLARKTAILVGLLRAVTGDAALRLPDGRVLADLAQLQALVLDPGARGLLREADARERVRDAFGVFGGPLLAGAGARADVSEEQLAAIAPNEAVERREELRGLVFAWQFLRIPVLWLGQGRWRATSIAELLAVMAEPEGRKAAAEAAASGVVSSWLRLGIGREVPPDLGSSVDAARFPQFALWLGDVPPKLTLKLQSASLVIPEDGHSVAHVDLHNDDAVRAACATLTVAESGAQRGDGLVLKLGASGTVATVLIEPGKSATFPVRVAAPAGRSGTTSLSFDAALLAHDGTQISAASAELPIRIVFPGALLAKGAIIGASLGAAIAMALRGVRGVIFPGDPFSALKDAATGAFAADIRDRAWAVVVGALVLAMLGYRILVGIMNERAAPQGEKVRAAMKIAGFAALVLGPVGGCAGCIGSCSKGVGEAASSCAGGSAGGVGAGVAIGLFLMIRPGAVVSDARRAFVHDALFGGLGLVAVFGGKGLADVMLKTFFGADVGVIAIATALGATAPFSDGGIIAAYGALGVLFGATFGLRRALVNVNRRALGWAIVVAATASVIVAGAARATPERLTGVADPPVAPAECRAALQHAFEVVAHEEASEWPSGYATSPDARAEIESAAKRCDRASRSEVTCIVGATTVAALAQCGPFWLGEKR